VVADLMTVVVSVGAYLAGRAVYHGIVALADPVVAAGGALASLQTKIADAATKAGEIPAFGDTLRMPFDDIVAELSSLVAQLSDQVALIQNAAGVTGLAVFFIPLLVWWSFWLPARMRFAREASAASKLLGAGVGMDLFALRGLANLPLSVLATTHGDPVSAWRNGDVEVINGIARRELDRVGVRPPGPKKGLS
jgi:hypothetical protein